MESRREHLAYKKVTVYALKKKRPNNNLQVWNFISDAAGKSVGGWRRETAMILPEQFVINLVKKHQSGHSSFAFKLLLSETARISAHP